jgi:hypothetical protein
MATRRQRSKKGYLCVTPKIFQTDQSQGLVVASFMRLISKPPDESGNYRSRRKKPPGPSFKGGE